MPKKSNPPLRFKEKKIQATYYFSDGSVHKKGFFKSKKPVGEWTEYDRKGNKIAVGFYDKGRKSGTWFQWNNGKLRQIDYKNNTIASVSNWKEEANLTVSN